MHVWPCMHMWEASGCSRNHLNTSTWLLTAIILIPGSAARRLHIADCISKKWVGPGYMSYSENNNHENPKKLAVAHTIQLHPTSVRLCWLLVVHLWISTGEKMPNDSPCPHPPTTRLNVNGQFWCLWTFNPKLKGGCHFTVSSFRHEVLTLNSSICLGKTTPCNYIHTCVPWKSWRKVPPFHKNSPTMTLVCCYNYVVGWGALG